MTSLSHQVQRAVSGPLPVASSANHTSPTKSLIWQALMRGTVARAGLLLQRAEHQWRQRIEWPSLVFCVPPRQLQWGGHTGICLVLSAMASGSPCVVPSREYRVWLSTKSSASPLYVLISTVVIDGHTVVMLRRATCLLRRLNALDASNRLWCQCMTSA